MATFISNALPVRSERASRPLERFDFCFFPLLELLRIGDDWMARGPHYPMFVFDLQVEPVFPGFMPPRTNSSSVLEGTCRCR